jgi:predicted chitinase
LTAGLVSDIQCADQAIGGGPAADLLIADSLTAGLNTSQTAYVLASAAWESSMGKRMTEPATAPQVPSYVGKLGNANLADATAYRGRGFVQITGKVNYQKWSNVLGINLVGNPVQAATPEIASQIAVLGSLWGGFTGKALSGYDDYIGDRAVINGDTAYATDRWGGPTVGQAIANRAFTYFAGMANGCGGDN